MENPLPPGLVPALEEFFKTEETRLPGCSYYPEVFSHPVIFPLQRIGEMQMMMLKAGAIEPETVYEIGADKAGGLYHWCKCLPSVKNVIACEIRGTPYRDAFERAFPHLNFLWLDGVSSYSLESLSAVGSWLAMNNTKIDAMFIDGDKSAFLRDFDCYLPMMRKGGLVFMHDIQDDYPGSSFRQAASRYPHEEIIDKTDTEAAIKRRSEGIEVANPHEGWLRYWNGRSCGVGVLYV